MSNKLTKEDYQKIAHQRNHEIISFENYINVRSQIGVHCLTCDHVWYPTGHAYKNAKKTGCPNCKRLLISKQHKTKIVSEETRRKIGEKASKRAGSLTGKFGAAHPRFKVA